MNHLLTMGELAPHQIQQIIDHSTELEQKPQMLLAGKNIGFIFEKPSLRTKTGTEAAINHLGGNVLHIEPELVLPGGNSAVFGCRESIKDAMCNISQWCDAIFARVYKHGTLKEMAFHSTVPVINALCDMHHPMQALADLLTIQQKFGRTKKIKLAYIGDANNVAFSLTETALMFGHSVWFAGPEKYSWSTDQMSYFALLSVQYGGSFHSTEKPAEAAEGADAVYTDTFLSMGEEHLYDEKMAHFESYQVNESLFSKANSHAGFMHCLPAHRGVEVTGSVMDHPNSWVYQQARNRMIVSKGVFATLLAGDDQTESVLMNGVQKVPY